jgi:hypothetical protein
LTLKDRFTASACDSQPPFDVIVRLFQGQRAYFAANRDPLPELAPLRPVKVDFQLRLSREHDLEHFVGRSLDVQQ